ncbi:response regulator [Halovenus marina]|uniref:sensor histidine kinase n=1 Tax=Halovenus marina TaxID=3396621 RepID=UPI003F56811D
MGEPIRVLHVDDDPTICELTSEVLTDHSDRIEVTTTTDPAEALDIVESASIQCVVSDYEMGEMDGLELLTDVRTAHPDLPFILFTSKGSEEVASDAISAGVTDYLQKGTGVDQYTVLANRIENVVEKYRAEQNLQQSEAELRRKSKMLDVILDHVPLHIYMKDEEARHTWVSDYFMGSNDQIGKTDPEYFDQEWAEETYQEELEIIETGEPIIKQERYDPARDMWVLNSKVPWKDDDGEVVGLVGATWDITERKEMQIELEHQKERLETLMGALSHDMRNTLQLAQTNLTLYSNQGDQTHLETLERTHERMEQILNDTLTLARNGKSIGETEPVDLETIAEKSWATVDTQGATLVVDGTLSFEADRSRLQQLFENLFHNAVQHAGENVTITVGANDASFYVEDDGAGVPPEERETIFEVGYTTSDDGTGFGLAIVEAVTSAHGWEITIEDGDEGGARFVIDGVSTLARV